MFWEDPLGETNLEHANKKSVLMQRGARFAFSRTALQRGARFAFCENAPVLCWLLPQRRRSSAGLLWCFTRYHLSDDDRSHAAWRSFCGSVRVRSVASGLSGSGLSGSVWVRVRSVASGLSGSIWIRSIWIRSVWVRSVWIQSVWMMSVWVRSVWMLSVWMRSVWMLVVWIRSVSVQSV